MTIRIGVGLLQAHRDGDVMSTIRRFALEVRPRVEQILGAGDQTLNFAEENR